MGKSLPHSNIRLPAYDDRLGDRRTRRYTAAFDWVMESIETGHYLEAVAILDSLLSDRLASRYWHIRKQLPTAKDTTGNLCAKLLKGYKLDDNPAVEKDPSFIAVIEAIWEWTKVRNEAVHATAKVFSLNDPDATFAGAVAKHRTTALVAVKLLQRFDDLDTADRDKAGEISATYPNAFFPGRSPRY
ncbi:hypothetical protein [Nocardia sp. NPDC058480]|uniref:hypothetical protein n=1 Tax=unclassified Nocardia TaxID=2637762 RepID=UPI0036463781